MENLSCIVRVDDKCGLGVELLMCLGVEVGIGVGVSEDPG